MTPEAGQGGLPHLILCTPDGARADVYQHGAHVVAWQPAGGPECLFLSGRSAFQPGAAIRGGVPVIFPQFAAEGPLPKHGFARTLAWEWAQAAPDAVTLRLSDSDATRRLWPCAFRAELTVALADRQLALTLGVTNTDTQPFAFTAALHTYLRVAEIGQAAVEGLAGRRYRDSAHGNAPAVEHEPAVRFAGEVDRVYFQTPEALRLHDGARRLALQSAGFPDAVVWNPGALKGAALNDLEPDGYRRFVCVEAAVVGAPVALAPGAEWRGRQILIAE